MLHGLAHDDAVCIAAAHNEQVLRTAADGRRMALLLIVAERKVVRTLDTVAQGRRMARLPRMTEFQVMRCQPLMADALIVRPAD